MGRSRPVRSRIREHWRVIIVSLPIILVALPFLLSLAGDAQVHLAVAERFVRGFAFQYNAGGETVIASSSPFWTLMIALFFEIVNSWAPLLLMVVVLAVWLTAAYLIYRSAKDHWHFSKIAVWSLLMLWLLHTVIVSNALGGLENILTALQLLLLYWLTARYRDGLTVRRSVILGLLLGWTFLTRLDAGLFALILLAQFILAVWSHMRLRDLAVHLTIIVTVSILMLIPWYAYQYGKTATLVSDSAIARLYGGRQGSLILIPDILYLHPKALISLGTAFLPLVLGFVLTAGQLTYSLIQSPSGRLQHYRENYPLYSAIILIVAGLFLFTFVVGAEAFGRYFLPIFPFLFLAGVDGWQRLYFWMENRGWRTAGIALASAACLFMVFTSAFDFYRRLGPGSYGRDHISNVFYGPADKRYYSRNLPDLLLAPQSRTDATEDLLTYLGVSKEAKISLAVTEVQIRYFVDDRIDIISLDGRTSARIVDHIDSTTGVPDFEQYFLDVHPDYVHVSQWCEIGGWLSSFISFAIEDNLVCNWGKRAMMMQPGESFQWLGRRVELVAPEILRIYWEDPNQDA